MRIIISIGCFFLGGMLLVYGATKFDNTRNTIEEQVNADFIHVDTEDYDFGNILANEGNIKHKFIIMNNSSKPCSICSVATGCSCMKADFSKGVILPMCKSEITISLNPQKVQGYFHKRIMIFINDGQYYKFLSVKGTII